MTRTTRRGFLKNAAVYGGAIAMANYLGQSLADALQAVTIDWKKQVGLELFTVRDVMGADYEGTLAKVAAIGYKEIEPAGGYNNMDPRAFRAMLDRHGLSMPSTHSGASGTGADLEKQLEGFQVMGLKYTGISAGGPVGGRGGGGRGDAGARGGGRGPGGTAPPPATVDSVKRRAEQLNANGKIAQKFGMKILVHNHTQEFDLLDDGKTTTYDVVLAHTDPALVAMQLDIGWASVAGQDILGLFKKNPGRFELWHVKDAIGIKDLDPKLTPAQRRPLATLVPVGLGQVDYKTIFANATLAGLKHFCIEQDNAAAWGDAIAATRVSFQNLTTKTLT
jgi:sugar phosphate isomerase/epimerase